MRWQGRRQSTNIEDRRGQGGFGGLGGSGPRIGMRLPGGSRGGGGIGIVGLLIILGIAWFAGINPLELLGTTGGGLGGGTVSTNPGQQTGQMGTPSDDGAQFIATVLADTEETWTRIFAAGGEQYQVPTLVLFTRATESACGYASSATGPFYCPGDRKLYIDLAFYDQLRTEFQAPGDFAEAYVIAHEVGHHVQNLMGTLPQVDQMRRQADEVRSNELSMRLELQADCYAGIWARNVDSEGILDAGDIDEALRAAAAVGDDTLQQRTQGYVVPETFNHGTAEQRSSWFKRGYQDGQVKACDTFSGAI